METQDVEQRPVADNLFVVDQDKVLVVCGRCDECGAVSFPRPSRCARCVASSIDEHLLLGDGSLWTFTVQSFRPKSPYDGPTDFVPYGVGYVALGGEVLVEGRLTESDPEKLSIGMPMHAVVESYTTDAEGLSVTTFAFATGRG